MQAKDIPDDLVIDLIATLREIADEEDLVRTTRYAMRGSIWPSTQNILAVFTEFGIPEKVVMAKLRKLEKRGLINGCACGCSGNFSIPASQDLQAL